ncbi:hypothetical protein DM01DRAFT_260067 [Hesseltinella vesiculosa]|uniref:Chitobiosyldiphosphodolichol beta-mannosyltransferase n=1 Tax=Hesseltinella vesiculosa TaxID=101127 RepID=A0A1X2G300_9FUNG|nr:hypothetical protein DM01DRAFT_260067 [Hesseltinella vesiculosa]
MPKLFYLLWAPFKTVFLALQLFWLMCCVTQCPHIIFVQNPPSIPTLFIAKLTAFIRQTWLIIDWHNFGYSVLGKTLGDHHPIVSFAESFERYFGRDARAHLTVTDKMQNKLKSWGVQGTIVTLRDRPQANFKRLTLNEIHDASCLNVKVSVISAEFLGHIHEADTLLTCKENGDDAKFRQNRPKLVVSSTSWTEDEDFSLLLQAAKFYDDEAPPDAPNILFVITGKGPLKDFYEKKISKMHLTRTRIVTSWLSNEDYSSLLGCADLGVSLHTSTSGVDLPMKIVDMFGSGLPVCAVNFEWWVKNTRRKKMNSSCL